MTRNLAIEGMVLFLLLLLLPCEQGGAAAPATATNLSSSPNLLLITLDTTRADHLGCYGNRKAGTPVLDRLASEGALFVEAHSHVPLTLPSHSVMMTGDLPSTLNLRVNGLKLGSKHVTLASVLKRRGYWTGAVVASVILDRSRGLSRGFDVYDDRMTLAPRGGGPPEERRGEDVTTAALKVVSKMKRPFFLWVHYYDPHYEYRPPMPWSKAFAGDEYDGEISYMDSCIGKLLRGLGRKGLLKNTVIAAVGDHGEGLMEHGERQHGVFLYEYALHVPLIIKWPGHIGPGLKITDLCGLEDLAPTLLDMLGLDIPAVDGRSLRPLLKRRSLSKRGIYIESYHGFFTYGWAPLRGWMNDRYKYIEAPRPELYEWRRSEDKNIYRPDSAVVAEMKSNLSRFPEARIGERKEMVQLLKDPSNAETLKKLMSLGYLSGAGGASMEVTGLLDPKDAIDIETLLRRAKEELDGGHTDRGMKTLLSILKRNPQNIPALSMLGLAYMNTGHTSEAEACFREEIKLKPQMESAHLNLGSILKKTGRLEEAVKEYRAALALSPRFPEAISNLSDTFIRLKRNTEAVALLREALGNGVESSDIYFELGLLDATGGRWEEARFAFSKALSMDPTRDEAAANLGKVAFQQGKTDEAILAYKRAARIAPGKAGYLATLGSLYLNSKDDPMTALSYFRKALNSNPYGSGAGNLRALIQNIEHQLTSKDGATGR